MQRGRDRITAECCTSRQNRLISQLGNVTFTITSRVRYSNYQHYTPSHLPAFLFQAGSQASTGIGWEVRLVSILS